MHPPAILLAIFTGVCGLFAYFPPPIMPGLDPGMGRTALAAGATLLIAALWDMGTGFREGRARRRAAPKS